MSSVDSAWISTENAISRTVFRDYDSVAQLVLGGASFKMFGDSVLLY